MNENNNLNINNVNLDEEEQVLIKTQEELTSLLRAVKNGEPVDEKYKSCMKKNPCIINQPPCVDLYRCFRDGFVAEGAIKNVDDIFQYLVFDFGPNHLWSHDNFTDQKLICKILYLVCQPEFNINRIKNAELRLAARAFDVNAIKQNKTKYIFNLKKQVELGTINPQNYSDEVHVQDFLLPDSIEDIGDLVKFMGYDSENPGNRVLPKMTWWELLFIPPHTEGNMHSQVCPNTGESIKHPGFLRGCLKRHYNTINDRELINEFNELRKNCSSHDEQKKLYSDLRSKREKNRDNSGAIKDFNQLKKIVDFPEDQKLPGSHTMFFANASVGNGVEFLKLFDDESKVRILTYQDEFRVFKPGAFSFETRGDVEKFLREECRFKVYEINFIHYFIAVIVDFGKMILAIIQLMFFVFAYVPMRMCGAEPLVKYTFFEYTRQAHKMSLNECFNLAIKNIEENYAAVKQPNNLNSEVKSENNQREIPHLEQVPLTVSINNNN